MSIQYLNQLNIHYKERPESIPSFYLFVYWIYIFTKCVIKRDEYITGADLLIYLRLINCRGSQTFCHFTSFSCNIYILISAKNSASCYSLEPNFFTYFQHQCIQARRFCTKPQGSFCTCPREVYILQFGKPCFNILNPYLHIRDRVINSFLGSFTFVFEFLFAFVGPCS